jgi:hypothetical protein
MATVSLKQQKQGELIAPETINHIVTIAHKTGRTLYERHS